MAYKPAILPPERQSPDATIPEVMAFRRESARTVFRKIRGGIYLSYKSGDTRLIELGERLCRPGCLPQTRPATRATDRQEAR
jgi:hypothetical protein